MSRSTHRPAAQHPAAQHPAAQHPAVHTPTVKKAGVFTIEYTLFTNATPGHDIQFGMDFSLTSTVKEPLSQLIFPAVAVGTNKAGEWNIDNHHSENSPASLIFANAEHGTITDKPREIVAPHQGVKTTKFAVYLVNPQKGTVGSTGVQFSYSINTSDPNPSTSFIGPTSSNITKEQKDVMERRFKQIKFV